MNFMGLYPQHFWIFCTHMLLSICTYYRQIIEWTLKEGVATTYTYLWFQCLQYKSNINTTKLLLENSHYKINFNCFRNCIECLISDPKFIRIQLAIIYTLLEWAYCIWTSFICETIINNGYKLKWKCDAFAVMLMLHNYGLWCWRRVSLTPRVRFYLWTCKLIIICAVITCILYLLSSAYHSYPRRKQQSEFNKNEYLEIYLKRYIETK